MNVEYFRDYCLAKPGATEGFPFGEDTLVLKVMGKMFALTSLSNDFFSANLKCKPEKSLELRETYEAIKPGYHMNKKHWNTISLEFAEISDTLTLELIDHSYDLVVASLTKKMKEELNDLKKLD